MRIDILKVVALALLWLALVPCIPARLQPSFSTVFNLVNASRQDGTPPTRRGAHQASWATWSRASAPGVERRSLKSSSKPKASKPKKAKLKWGRGKASLWGSVIGVSVFLGMFALCAVCFAVTEKREEDPNWKLRTLLRRRLKRKSKAGEGDMAAMEKPNVEQK